MSQSAIGYATLTAFSFYRTDTALREMQTRSSDENSVRPSVRLSVKRVICDKTKECYVQIFIPYEKPLSFSPNSIALLTNYVTVVKVRPRMSVKYCLQFQSPTFGHN